MRLHETKKNMSSWGRLTAWMAVLFLTVTACSEPERGMEVRKGDHIVLIGNNLGSRMINYGHFETEMQLRYPDSLLYIRNMADGGNTPGFRPHPSRKSPWAFPGADTLGQAVWKEHWEVSKGWLKTATEGHFETPDQWLEMLKADVIVAFFGYNESFSGPDGLARYKAELHAFIDHTLAQRYNGRSAPKLALVSPIAFEDLSGQMDLPDGKQENANLKLYADAMREVAAKDSVLFVDAFGPSKQWYAESDENLTADGFQLNDLGHRKMAQLLADKVFGANKAVAEKHREAVHAAVMDKNWYWHNDFKIPNGVHVYGRRHKPYGPDNYPAEIEKIREMTDVRDQAIWKAAQGEDFDVATADKKTKKLPEIPTNYKQSHKNGDPDYLYGEDALAKIKTAPGYKIELFASEKEFNDLANPVQMAFDNQGRLWVGVMPSYPHYKAGDSKPNDKLIILEDTDNDGKADKQTTFADGLHLTIGFEFAPEGVYVSQGTNLVLLKDTNGDDKADVTEVILSGFDDHDTHHAISAFCADPSGAIYMGEGVFLHSNIETAYGPVRGTNGGFFRYSPQRHHLERSAQLPIPNPWGIAFDEWGQNFFAHTSNPNVTWMMPGTIKSRFGEGNPLPDNLIEDEHRVRPTSGIEFVSSRHFPDEVQGDLLINNTIGFLGTKQHTMTDDPESAGYLSQHRQDLVVAEDGNYRPVDLEFAPDGSLYILDWHNVLIGHMQHNARDPLRDHAHGRVYRVTYPGRPLVTPAKVAGASIPELLENLKLPEYRTRYRSRRELRGRDVNEVMPALNEWVAGLDKNDAQYEHRLMEALFVSWGMNQVDAELLQILLAANDYRARAAAVKVLRYSGHQLENQAGLLLQAAQDNNARVRLEAMVAASWLPKPVGLPIVEKAAEKGLDSWGQKPYEGIVAHFNDHRLGMEPEENKVKTDLTGAAKQLYMQGHEIYGREGFCATCHQENGKGLSASGFPPIDNSRWVTGSKERLIKLTLNGLLGPIEVKGKKYPGQVPMTPFGGMLNDKEIAAVLTYVRNSFGNKASAIYEQDVKRVRESIKDKSGFYEPAELLKEHPHQ
ncbi:PVC-type heme-binding CxxCH protein [Sediminicola luteus]|uniref:Dehydrogenase n=1 Tax=Sediminicola luteus TaxID=319238 RepID=A0A2A4GBG8_9FLAO|nr:PVC-type heme-binding CxxCH protein [Sediminicola luteus]PCE65793.1 dehydrogenase [Sediminicola luteus]